jgi:hypothetical protein
MWVRGETSLLLKLKGEGGTELKIGTQSTANPDEWGEVCFDLSDQNGVFVQDGIGRSIFLKEVKSLLLFPQLEESASDGILYLDDLELSEEACPAN